MPRTSAPDPLVVEYIRRTPPGGKFTIHARRDGSYAITQDGRTVAALGPQLGAYFGASKYPSNRLQAEAVRAAQLRIEAMAQ